MSKTITEILRGTNFDLVIKQLETKILSGWRVRKASTIMGVTVFVTIEKNAEVEDKPQDPIENINENPAKVSENEGEKTSSEESGTTLHETESVEITPQNGNDLEVLENIEDTSKQPLTPKTTDVKITTRKTTSKGGK